MIIGGGSLARLGALLTQFGFSRPLVVTDPWMHSSGTIEKCLAPLREAGFAPVVFHETVPDPTDTVIAAGVAILQAGDFDVLIGFGGGSPMDTAKAMAILAAAPAGTPMSAFKVPVAADHAALPVICIPTTAGTGSEATRFTVITDAARDEKMLIAGLGALPLAAIVLFGFLAVGLPLAALPLYLHGVLGFDTVTVGWVVGIQSLATVLTRQFAGNYCDRHGSKASALVGLPLAAVAGLIYLLSTFMPVGNAALGVLVVGRLLMGLAESLFLTGTMTWGIGRIGPTRTGMCSSKRSSAAALRRNKHCGPAHSRPRT
eukprot:gene45626-55843_t